ncbi:MAG: response regulator [Anaerolineae bacterium]|nr:response regulator [Anaerolineae bacterium]
MSFANKRFFLIEDDPNNVAIIASILRRVGATVHFDYWGHDIPDRIARLMPIDLILLDLMLPGEIDGYGVFDQLRERPELAAIPIVAVTAMDPDNEIPRAKAKGFSGFIAKPVRHRTFARYIEAILNGQPVWADME